MKITGVFLQNYSAINMKTNSNANPNFKGILKMGKDIRRCCGLYDNDDYESFLRDWSKRLPKNTGIIIHYKNSDGNFEKYIVKSIIQDKDTRILKKYDEEEIAMYVDGISERGTCCRWDDTEIIYNNELKLLKCLNKHLDKINARLANINKA